MEQEHHKLERITLRNIFNYLLDIFNIEKGLFYTVKGLSLHPAKTIKTYLFENRDKLVKPFRYLLFSTAIMAFLTINYIGMQNSGLSKGFEVGYTGAAAADGEENEAATKKIKEITTHLEAYFSKYYNALVIFGVPFFALAFFWFLKKPQLNYAEHLVISSYLTGHQSVLTILLIPLTKYNNSLGLTLTSVLTIAYTFYVYIRFFDYKLIPGFFRTLLAFLVGTFIYTLVFAITTVIFLFLTMK